MERLNTSQGSIGSIRTGSMGNVVPLFGADQYTSLDIGEKKEVTVRMSRYECSVCGWIYNPELGDQEANIAAGTPFEQLPNDWVCPVCGAPKSSFEKME